MVVVVVEVMSEGTAHSFHISQVVAEGEEEVMVVVVSSCGRIESMV